MRRVLASWMVVAGVALVAAPWASAAPEVAAAQQRVDARLAAQLEAARPLDEVRTGISEGEPEYCSAQVIGEVNPAAANRSSIEVGPPKFLVEGLPAGSTWRHCVSIYNRSPDPRTVQLETIDVVGSLDPDVRLETREQPVGVGSWITPALEEVELQPGERLLVPYLVQVPTDPPGGTVTGGIAVRDQTGIDEELSGARITRSLVVQLQVTFPGGVARPLEVDDVESPRLVWTGQDPDRVSVEYTISNVGEVVDTAQTVLEVEGLFGRSVAKVEATPEVLIPRSAQQFRLDWRGLPWIGVYRPTLVVTSQDGEVREQLPRVWVLPPWWVLALAAGAVLLAIAGIVRRRRAWRAYLDEDVHEHEGWDDEGHLDDPI